MTLGEVYNKRILELAGNIPRLGRLSYPDASATTHAPICGSIVTVDVLTDEDMVVDFAHEVDACALGQAAASLMARHVIGTRVAQLRAVRTAVRAMLNGGDLVAIDGWMDLDCLIPMRDFKSRHASVLLTFDATLAAAESALVRRSVPAGERGLPS